MVKLTDSCPICGGDIKGGSGAPGSDPTVKVEPLWRNIVCSEICYLQLSRGKAEPTDPDPQAGPMEAAMADQASGRVIPFTGRSRRAYNHPGAAHRLHLPAHHSADSIAPLIRLAESSGPDSSFTHMVMLQLAMHWLFVDFHHLLVLSRLTPQRPVDGSLHQQGMRPTAWRRNPHLGQA